MERMHYNFALFSNFHIAELQQITQKGAMSVRIFDAFKRMCTQLDHLNNDLVSISLYSYVSPQEFLIDVYHMFTVC